jgi:hypothetical protein
VLGQLGCGQAIGADLNSLWDFEEKLANLGHYLTYYTSIEDLKL